ncbi:MAG TPA: bifunctional 4-hydroxy-2-oxoglutarate aldolase/2-dehydro-3-deoxy-phosphogluconate aldolase [Panacibacter sp.]|nr:bifunctional 4-hydroxy-2-oxoglutarate aldolase/2-dehydro-3-deoxy-phosphogluconate aldolase [Panacibacter sp.]HNP45887.1 bifunctional 4-hydroxy-2-oxoglutarate aldolase/2-dehydro-3-deoxy-phosphogluconate aldolase [Panacibacter sp.]
MITKEAAYDAIVKQGIMPLFYYPDVDVCVEVVRTLYRAGVRVMEVTNRAVGALQVYSALKQRVAEEMPEMILGAGTLKTMQDAIDFQKAGADFFVAPNLSAAVAAVAADNSMLWIPGCMTPTEIQFARENGAMLIKIFPANVLGPGFVSAVREVFPGQAFIPTGGVEISKENISGWFRSGVIAVGMGSKLISKEILQHKQYDLLYDKTIEVLQLIKENR